MAPASSGEAEHLIEPAWLRPNDSMSPTRRDEGMTGTRFSGLPSQHRLALENDRTASRPPGSYRARRTPTNRTYEALTGFDNQYVDAR